MITNFFYWICKLVKRDQDEFIRVATKDPHNIKKEYPKRLYKKEIKRQVRPRMKENKYNRHNLRGENESNKNL